MAIHFSDVAVCLLCPHCKQVAMAEAKIVVTVKDNSVNVRVLSHSASIRIEHVVSIEVNFRALHYSDVTRDKFILYRIRPLIQLI